MNHVFVAVFMLFAGMIGIVRLAGWIAKKRGLLNETEDEKPGAGCGL